MVARGSAASLASVIVALVPVEINFSLSINLVTIILLIKNFVKCKLLCILKVTYKVNVECSTNERTDRDIYRFLDTSFPREETYSGT